MLLLVKILLVLICWAVQVAWFWIWWDGATADCQASVALGKRPAWMVRWALPVSAVIGLGPFLLEVWQMGWDSESWVVPLVLWPFLTVVVHGLICLYVSAPIVHPGLFLWYVFTLRWGKASQVFRESVQLSAEWAAYRGYQKIRRKAGDEAALEWLRRMTRALPLSFRAPVHFDPELARKLEEAEREAARAGDDSSDGREGPR